MPVPNCPECGSANVEEGFIVYMCHECGFSANVTDIPGLLDDDDTGEVDDPGEESFSRLAASEDEREWKMALYGDAFADDEDAGNYELEEM